MTFQELRHPERVLAMTLQTHAKGFQTLQKEPGIEGRGRRANVAKQLHTSLNDVRERSQGRCIANTVIRRIRVDQIREASTGSPIELPTIDNHAANRSPMTTDKFGGGVDHNISAMLEGLDQIGRWQRIIEDQRQSV